MFNIRFGRFAGALGLMLCTLATPALADDAAAEAQALVDQAQVSLQNFMADPDHTGVRGYVQQACGVLIVPTLVKAGFIVGGSGGSGVLLVKDPATGTWSPPAFYAMGTAGIGLQIGVQASEVVMLVMTENGVNSLLSTNLKLGVDASIAAGPVGAGAAAATTDIVSYARAKGVFAGLSLDGAIVTTRDALSQAYYGRPATPVDILVKRNVSHAGAAALRSAVASAAGG